MRVESGKQHAKRQPFTMPKATFYIPKGLLLQATKAVFTRKYAEIERPAKCNALVCKALA